MVKRSELKIFICSKPKPVLMFNMYTKLTLGAFALLISGGAWGQCADGEIAIDYSIGGGNFPSEISWQLNDASGENLFLGGAGEAGTWCLALATTHSLASILSAMDGMCTAEFYNSGALIGELAVEGGQGSVVLTVSADVPGCTDPAAGNYNSSHCGRRFLLLGQRFDIQLV